MDPTTDVLYGPHRLQANGLITVPIDLTRELGMERGVDRAHWALNPDIEGTLILIPSRKVAGVTTEILELLRSHGA